MKNINERMFMGKNWYKDKRKIKFKTILLIVVTLTVILIQSSEIIGKQMIIESSYKANDLPDVTNLPYLQTVSEWDNFIGSPKKVIVKNDRAYTYAASDAFIEFNISNPTKLEVKGIAQTFFMWDFVINDNIAIFSSSSSFSIYDITNISNIELLYKNETIGCHELVLNNNILVVDTHVFNVTNPTHPVEIMTLTSDLQFTSIANQDSKSYLIAANRTGYLEIYNITNDKHIELLANHTNLSNQVSDVMYANNELLVLNDYGNFTFFNISNIKQIKYVSHLDDFADILGLRGALINESKFYIFDRSNGMSIYDISNLSRIELVSQNSIYKTITMMDIKGSIGYAVDDDDYLRVINLSDSLNPKIIDSFDFGCFAERVDASEKYVAIQDQSSSWNDKLAILNIENPSEPYLMDTIPIGFRIGYIKIIGNHIYVFDEFHANLTVLYIDSTDEIKKVNSIKPPAADIRDCVIQDNKAIFLSNSAGYFIVDITNPATPIIVDHNDIGFGYQMEIIDNIMYVSQLTAGGIGIYDVTDIYNPLEIARIPNQAEWYPWEFEIYNDILYLEAYFMYNSTLSGLWTYDVSDKANPEFIEEILNPPNGFKLELDGSNLYVSYYPTIVFDLTDNKFEPIARHNISTWYDMKISNGYMFSTHGASGLTIVNATLDYHSTPSQVTTNQVGNYVVFVFSSTYFSISVLVIIRRKNQKL